MNLEEKLRLLKQAADTRTRELGTERRFEYLHRAQPKKLPAQRAPKGIEEYVEGRVERNAWGEFFLARQALPFGRPYGKLRIGDVATANLDALDLFLDGARLPQTSRLAYLDTETTGLVGDTGTCAFLVGIGAAEGSRFVVRQFFLRDYPEEKALLASLAEALEPYEGVVTFNGKTFDIPLLETRYALAQIQSPFARLLHLDLLHLARRLWKLRLENCELVHLERELLGIGREGDVAGSEIPGIYFDYLRTGDPRGLQPVFYHNALDVVTLAALATELASAIAGVDAAGEAASLDLFSLSRIFERAGVREKSVAACQRALAAGLPPAVETRALWQLATQHKRERLHDRATEFWLELTRREPEFAAKACEELSIHYEHRQRDFATALRFAESALERLRAKNLPTAKLPRLKRRLERLRKKSARAPRASL